MTPFERFFEHEFPRMLDHAGLDEYGGDGQPGGLFTGNVRLQDCSWDRKAAYLIWCMRDDAYRAVALPPNSTNSGFEDLL